MIILTYVEMGVYWSKATYVENKGGGSMARPRKCRRVCGMPRNNSFAPMGLWDGTERIIMAVDEYETIRLIDLEGLTQEQCAKSMDIARSTVQSIYDSARKKLSHCLVNGAELKISGGEYILCEGSSTPHCGHCRKQCRKHNQSGG